MTPHAAECFCPYPQLNNIPGARQKRLMSMDLYRKILDEAATIPLLDQITITGLGETLLDRHLDERIMYARAKKPHATLDLYTNGSQLTVERGLRLAEAGLNIIYVSLNAVTARKRFEIMKLDDFDKVKANTHALIDKLISIGSKTIVIVKTVASKDLMDVGEIDEFVNEWGGMWNRFGDKNPTHGAYVHLETNWGGDTGVMRTTPTKACSRALNEIMVLSDGRAVLCCLDWLGKVTFGDLNTQTIREIFSSEKAQAYRLAHVEGRRPELELCRTCSAI